MVKGKTFYDARYGLLNEHYDWGKENKTPEYGKRAIVANQMFAKLALTEPITAVGFASDFLRLTRQICTETGELRGEQGGFFAGVAKNGIFYIFDHHRRGMGLNGVLEFDSEMLPIQEKIHRKTIQSVPGYKTIIYHNHPKESQRSLVNLLGVEEANRCIKSVKGSLNSGIYASLGITDIDTAINEEFSRMISEDDVRNTPGRYNLIISPTYTSKNPFSHLNLYDLSENRLIPIISIKASEVKTEIKKMREASKECYIECFGSDDLSNLTPEGYLKAFYAMHGISYLSPEEMAGS